MSKPKKRPLSADGLDLLEELDRLELSITMNNFEPMKRGDKVIGKLDKKFVRLATAIFCLREDSQGNRKTCEKIPELIERIDLWDGEIRRLERMFWEMLRLKFSKSEDCDIEVRKGGQVVIPLGGDNWKDSDYAFEIIDFFFH